MNTKNTLSFATHLSTSHTEDNVELQKLLSGRLKRLSRNKLPAVDPACYWTADFYGLHQSTLFAQASAAQKQEIMVRCQRHVLGEAYFIEKLGLTYCAKMVLLAETTEIAQLYSLLGADEATHLQWITPYVPPELRVKPIGPFLIFIANLIEQGDTCCLRYLLQILLEGWGLQHYKKLALSCHNRQLTAVFDDIVRDEALHQQTGSILFQPQHLSSVQQEFILDSLAYFLELVKVGPQAILAQIEGVLGGLTYDEKIHFMEEIDGPIYARKQLVLLKQLMSIPGCEKWIEKLTANKMFEPYSVKNCFC